MPKPTDEEVGQLLRETFAEKEELFNHLPEATTIPVRRRKAPVLLAAVAVLVVLGGTIAIAGIDRKPAPGPSKEQAVPSSGKSSVVHTGVANASENVTGHVSGLAIGEATKWERPAAGWPVVKVLDAPYKTAASAFGAGAPGVRFSADTRQQIESYAGVRIEWVKSRPTGPDVCTEASDGTPYVTVGQVVVGKGPTYTVGISMWRGCLDARWLTYSLAEVRNSKGGQDLKVTGTVGPVSES